MMRTRIYDFLAAILLLALAFLFMMPLAEGGFLTDDYHNIRFATHGPEGGGFFDPDDPTEVLAYFHQPATERYELYRPLVPISFRLSYELSGLDAKLYIWTNIGLHLLGGLLALFLMRTLLPDLSRLPLLFGTGLFLLSPLQTQVAYWSSARSDSLCWIFGALAVMTKWPDRRRWFLPTIFAALSLLAKEPGFVFLAVLALCDLLPMPSDQPTNAKARCLRIGLLVLVGLAYLFQRASVFGDMGGASSYGSISISDTLRLHGWENLKSGIKIALSPVTTFVVPEVAPRTLFGTLLAIGSGWILTLGLFRLIRRDVKKFLVVTMILVAPFLMTNLLSCLDQRFINTRGCYISMFSMGILMALAMQKMSKLSWALGIGVLGISMLISWRVQNLYVEAGQGTEAVLSAMRSPLKNPDLANIEEVVVLDYQHKSWFEGGFTAAGCLRPALQRPFTAVDHQATLVTLNSIDPNRQFLTPFHSVFPKFADAALLSMRLDVDGSGYSFDRLLPRENRHPKLIKYEVVKPGTNALLILDRTIPNTLQPRFSVRHQGPLASRYQVCLYGPKGRMIDATAQVDSTESSADGKLTVHLALLPLSVELAQSFRDGKTLAWAAYGYDESGFVVGQTQPTVYRVQLRGQ